MSRFDVEGPLKGAAFGATVGLKGGKGARALDAAMAAEPEALPAALSQNGGLLLIRGLNEINDDPGLLVRLSRVFGPEVEDYRHTLTNSSSVHTKVPEILLVSNLPPVGKMPPPRPEPPVAADGGLPVQYPHRVGWHTDQSYRRPPPDISLFYAATPVARDRGQPALYLCEGGQMDWFDGPFVGREPGPRGTGARLLDALMAHMTERRFVYAHEWEPGDMLVWDNRCLVHAATWYVADEPRMMWRTTVHGNPGAAYAGEAKSWIPAAAE